MPKAQARQVQINGPVTDADRTILTDEAVSFLTALSQQFEERRRQLLDRRRVRQQQIDGGALPDFLEETAWIRNSDWVAAPIPADLQDRRVEITGPVDRKMIINALNSGASVFMADFEDSNSPTWRNNLDGQGNLRDSVNGAIGYVSPEGKRYELGAKTAVLMVRPRGWHLEEKHFLVDGSPVSAALFDFGLFFSTTPRPSWPRAAAHISTCRKWRAIWKPGCGTTCFTSRSSRWACRAGAYAQPC
jgi:malate synthase